MSYNAGTAFLSVRPDMSSFNDEVREKLSSVPDANVRVTADTTPLSADLDAATRDRTAKVTADADTAAAKAKLDDAAKPRTVTLKAVADSGAVSKISGLLSPLVLGAGGLATALGPTTAGAALGIAGIGVAFAAAAVDAAAFGVIAKGMFTDVEAAQKKLTAAQAAYAKATTPAGRAKALAAEQAATAKLTVSEKDLLVQLTALEGGWKKFSAAEQPVVESALTPWLQTATSGMKLLKPLVEGGAAAVRQLGTEAQTALKSPFWSTFTSTLGTTGQIALTAFGEAAGKLGDGLAHLFVTFAPDIDKLLTGIPKLAGYFDTWAKSVTSGGLERFFATTFSHANLEALSGDLKNVGSFLQSVGSASAAMSGNAFAGLTNVLDIMGRLTPTEIEALTALFLAIKAIGAVSGAVNAASSFLDNAKSAAGKVKGLFGSTADAEAEGAASGKAAGTAASAAWKLSFDPWAASADAEADAGARAAGESAGIAFTAAFTGAVEAGMPEAFLAIEAGDAVEAKALGAGLGADAATSFTTETAAEREAAGKKVVPGAVVKDGAGGESAAAKGTTAGSKAARIGSAAAGATVVLPIAGAIDQAIPKGPGGEWVNSWAPYEKIFTDDLPKAWSVSYEAFQSDFAGPMTAWFTNSLPHFFTAQIPMGWSAAYEGFQSDFAGPLTGFFTNVLPGFFTNVIPNNIWSPAEQGFMRDIGSPVAAWFTSTLPGIFSGSEQWLQGAGHTIGTGLETGWKSTEGALSTAFGASKGWVTGAVSTAGSWLHTAGGEVSSGFRTAWNATSGAVSSEFAKGKTWVTGQFSSAASWLHTAGGDVSSGFSKAWSATSGTVTSEFGKARGWVTGAFSGAGSWLSSAGTSLVNGLVNAIRASPGVVRDALLSLVPSSLKSAVSSAAGLLGFATGTPFAPPGWAWVGEQGPELVKFAGGEQVKTHAASAAMLGQMAAAQSLAALSVPAIGAPARLPGVNSPLQGGSLQLQVSYAGTGNELIDAIVGGLRVDIQGATGGDVQGHLGQGLVRT